MEKQEKLLSIVRNEIKKSKFLYMGDSSARVITGKEEGLFSWIAINFLKNNLNNINPEEIKETIGTMDLGGSSLEITFVTDEKKKTDDFLNLNLFNTDYNLYSTCFEGYGYKSMYQNLFIDLILANNGTEKNISHPCLLRGFSENITYNNVVYNFYGTGNFEECGKLTKKRVNKGDCKYEFCSLDGVYQPVIKSGQKFFCVSGFTNVAITFGFEMENKFYSVRDFRDHIIKFCNYDWEEATKLYPVTLADDLKINCYEGNYVYNLLVDAFGIDENSVSLLFSKVVNNTKISTWAVGAMIYEMLGLKF